MPTTLNTTDSSVSALIAAFNSGLDVLKKLKPKRRKKGDGVPLDEARLSRSLRKGPSELRHEYDKNYQLQGERFREGDGTFNYSSNWPKKTPRANIILPKQKRTLP
jgi:hypothetical protein